MAATSSPKERPLIERFESAVNVVRSLPKDGPFQPSDMIKLKFYGLYKQAREGPNTTPKPGFWDPTARAKWEAWTLCGTMSKEHSMGMYIRELEQIVETMPQSEEVEQFMKAIGPFYEFVEEEEEGEGETIKPKKQVTFIEQSPPNSNRQEEMESDSEGELEYEDSYDNLPPTTVNTTPLRTSVPQSLSSRRATPYISTTSHQSRPSHEEMTSQDTLSTNLFPSPNITPNNNNTTTTAIDSSPDGREREGEIIQGTQLLQAIQGLSQQITSLQNTVVQSLSLPARRPVIRSRVASLLLIMGPLLINIIWRYWRQQVTDNKDWWRWLFNTLCHVLFNSTIFMLT